MTPVDLTGQRTTELLQLYASILTELTARRVVRSRNAPAGDLAETLTAVALDGRLAPASAKSWDVETFNPSRRLQVKCRLLPTAHPKSQVNSPFRSWDFDACIFVDLDPSTYSVVRAVEVPRDGVESIAKESTWIQGFRVRVAHDLLAMSGAVDRTVQFQAALKTLDDVTAETPWSPTTG